MISKPTIRHVRALHVIVNSPAWADMREMIQGELDSIFNAMVVTADPALLHALRGRAQALRDILDLSSKTRETLEKLESTPKR